MWAGQRRIVGLLLVASVGMAACSGGDEPASAEPGPGTTTLNPTAPAPTAAPPTTDPPEAKRPATAEPASPTAPAPTTPPEPSRCDPAAADPDEPITIRIWHGLNGDLENFFQVIAGRFEADHPNIRLEVHRPPGSYVEMIELLAVTPDDELPDIVMGSNLTVRLQVDSGRFIPITECTGGDTPADLTDLLPVIARTYTVDDTLWAAPFNVSAPVMMYDRKRWVRAGLDPDDPPTDLDELEQATRRLVDSGEAPSGLILYERSAQWFLEQPAARTGRLLAEPANGRNGLDVDRYLFDTPDARATLERFRALARDGYVRWIGTNPSGNEDLSLMVLATDPGGITFNTSAVLGDILRLLDGGGIPPVEVGVAPFPGPGTGSTAGGAAWWLHDRGDPARAGTAAAVVAWLTRPELIAEVAAYTGYVPTTERAADHEITRQRWDEYPIFRVAYDQLAATPDTDAGAGLQVGPVVEVLRNLELAAGAAIDLGNDPGEELRRAEQRSLEITRIYADAIRGR